MEDLTPPATAPDPANPAPVAVVAPVTAPAASTDVPVDANGIMRAPGVVSKILGLGTQVTELQSAILGEQQAHAATRQKLTEAQATIASYQKMEADLAEAVSAGETAQKTVKEAESRAAAAEKLAAEAPLKIASGIVDGMSALGVDPAALPAAQTGEAKPGAGLKGKARAAAAFNAMAASK